MFDAAYNEKWKVVSIGVAVFSVVLAVLQALGQQGCTINRQSVQNRGA